MKLFFNSLGNSTVNSIGEGFNPSELSYYSGNPLFNWVSGDQYRDPSRIIFINNKYYFYASKFTENTFAGDTSEEIAVFESDTFFGNYTYQGVVLSKSVSGLDNRCIFTPDVIVKDGVIYMYYSGAGTSNNERWNGFVASSTNPLATFTRVQTTPIVYNSIDGVGNSFENYRIDALTPTIKPNGDIRLYYKAVTGDAVGGVTDRKFSYAEIDTMPNVVTKSNITFFDSSDTYNGDNPEGPSIWYQDNKYWLVYATPTSDGFGFSSSFDGVTNWQQEHVIYANQGFQRWHGAVMCLNDNDNVDAILFHDENANNDVRQISMLIQ